MYSVLIQNQKTMQVFREYYPIFLELLSDCRVGCCRWVESGRTIDTALPGLNELVGDKEEWRAVIVRMVENDEHDMKRHPATLDNPYDFKENALRKNMKVHESEIPLVRLTQMLGEVPAPIQTFVEEVTQERNKAPRRVYKPEPPDKEEMEVYHELVRKYEYDGHKPSDIILLTFNCVPRTSEKKTAERAWNIAEEESKANFSRRNWYSSNCRFLHYSYVKEGRTRKDADLFNFWNCVMLLASDYIDPSSLQAYRLYNTRVLINKETMTECFQKKEDELRGCRSYVLGEMKRDAELKITEKHPKPDYRAEISTDIRIPPDTEVSVDTNQFHLCPRNTFNEGQKWAALRNIAEDNLEAVFRAQDRILDEGANQMRRIAVMPDEMVTPLDKYEKLDMEAELSGTFDEILRTQNIISDTRNRGGERTDKLAEKVTDTIRGRIPRRLAAYIAAALVAAALLSVVPGFLIKPSAGGINIPGIVAAFIFFALGLGICELIVLFQQKGKLLDGVDNYNDAMEDNLAMLTQDMKFYSRFVSNIVSYSRGRSFLDTLKHKKFKLESEYELLQRHLDEIDLMMTRIDMWSKAFFLQVNPKRDIETDYSVDIGVAPRDNMLYTFDHGHEYMIPLNYTGDKIISPFSFIDRLIIEREELYSDARRNE